MKNDNSQDLCLDPPVNEVWSQALDLLARRGKVSAAQLNMWIKPASLAEISGNEAVLAVKNDMGKGFITACSAEIETVLQELLGRPITLRLTVDPSLIKDEEYNPSIASITVVSPNPGKTPNRVYETAPRQVVHNLNTALTFETFVVGSSNRFTHAAALAVADKPGQAYNPLFLYGGVGLGKTHLLHAIGNAILQKAPNTVINYLSCEKFTNEVINAIREQKTSDFRKKYRKVDVLLMDDIQFLEGKESTQEEFFHTFNHLREAGKQIVLTSDRQPKALAKLEERLRSRFEWGLISDIQPPDYEMRMAILRKKADLEQRKVPEFALEYIASTFTNHVRELESALLKVHAYANFMGADLTPASLVEALAPGGVQKKDRPAPSVDRIIDAVASYYSIEPADIRSAKRSQDLTIPRHIAMYLVHEIMSLSYPRVGQAFGNRKHTSALYACDKVKAAISEEPAVAEAVREITRQLGV